MLQELGFKMSSPLQPSCPPLLHRFFMSHQKKPQKQGGELAEFVGQKVAVLTNDARILLGTLKGCDNMTNVILTDAFERVFSKDEPMQVVPLGVFIVRGDNIAVVGLVDEVLDATIDWNGVLADSMLPIHH